jgi:hypothetical protein
MPNSVEWTDLDLHRLSVVEPHTELPDGSATAAGQWAVLAGGCALSAPSRCQLRGTLVGVVAQLDSYSMAEHENGLHHGVREPGCPACDADDGGHQDVHVLQRDTVDGLYLFHHEDQCQAYELSMLVLDYRIVCVADPADTHGAGGDRRRFTTYDQAHAALATHRRFCRDEWCWPRAPHVVGRTAGEHEPRLDVSSTNGAFLLRALGLAAELGADDVCGRSGGHDSHDTDELSRFPWHGEIHAKELLERIAVTRALCPEDAGVSPHTLVGHPRFIACGRRTGYLEYALEQLEEVARYASTGHRQVMWH